MVYTSLPAYMDPSNWQHQQPNHQGGSNTGASSPLIHPPPPPPSQPHGGSIRPGSLADRARMANIPMQEAPQKCPRCESTNTKFCYFNNYSLTQPRHFCKACKRYWTRGGALRNVPVGGGCRRNKKTRSTSTNTSSRSDRQTGSTATSAADVEAPLQPPQRFTAPLHQLGDHHHLGEIGLNYGLISGPMGGVGELNFHMGSAFGGLENWRVPQTHQFPFLSGLEASSSHGLLYPFEGGGGSSGNNTTQVSTSQIASAKMEDNYHQQLGLSRQFLGINNSNNNNNNNNNPTSEQYWSANGGGVTSAWTDLSAFNSTSNPL